MRFQLMCTPHDQESAERSHHVPLTSHLVILKAVCPAFPQGWPSLLSVLAYVFDTAPRPPMGPNVFAVWVAPDWWARTAATHA